MAGLKVIHDRSGYDEENYSLVMSKGRLPTEFYLIAGADLQVKVDDPSVVELNAGAGDDKAAHRGQGLDAWENAQVCRKVTLKALDEGSTTLRALGDTGDMIKPLPITVVANAMCRKVGKALGEVTTEFRQKLQGLSLRAAVIEIAVDQMNSAMSRTDGFGTYLPEKSYDWCGSFVYYCWAQACAIKGVTNPFGAEQKVLWSPQRAIEWGRKSPTVTLYRADDNKLGDVADLDVGDVVLLRTDSPPAPNVWKHVCMVYSISGDTIRTIDGNQGLPMSIKRVERSFKKKITNGLFELAFVHPVGV
jgi:hypothetical protein